VPVDSRRRGDGEGDGDGGALGQGDRRGTVAGRGAGRGGRGYGRVHLRRRRGAGQGGRQGHGVRSGRWARCNTLVGTSSWAAAGGRRRSATRLKATGESTCAAHEERRERARRGRERGGQHKTCATACTYPGATGHGATRHGQQWAERAALPGRGQGERGGSARERQGEARTGGAAAGADDDDITGAPRGRDGGLGSSKRPSEG